MTVSVKQMLKRAANYQKLVKVVRTAFPIEVGDREPFLQSTNHQQYSTSLTSQTTPFRHLLYNFKYHSLNGEGQ